MKVLWSKQGTLHFLKTSFIIRVEVSSQKWIYDTINENHQKDEEPMCNKMAKISKTFGPKFLTYLLENNLKTFIEAISTPKTPYWKETINNKLNPSYGTILGIVWSSGNKASCCKWIFKKKLKSNGLINKNNARLVANDID